MDVTGVLACRCWVTVVFVDVGSLACGCWVKGVLMLGNGCVCGHVDVGRLECWHVDVG